jgi:ribosomal protein L36
MKVKKSAKAIAAVVLMILFMGYLTVVVLELLGVLSYHQNQLIHYLEVAQTLVLELRLQIAGLEGESSLVREQGRLMVLAKKS